LAIASSPAIELVQASRINIILNHLLASPLQFKLCSNSYERRTVFMLHPLYSLTNKEENEDQVTTVIIIIISRSAPQKPITE